MTDPAQVSPRETAMPDDVARDAIALATRLLETSRAIQTRAERAESAKLARMMADPAGKAFTLAMVDRVFRSGQPHRQSARLRELLSQLGVPHYLPTIQRLMLGVGARASAIVPGPIMAAMRPQLRRESARVILDAEPAALADYLDRRRADGVHVNLNQLGEAILGEAEAKRRLDALLSLLRNPRVDYVSVKISAIFSQVTVVDFDDTLATIKDRLRVLYRAALPGRKFVNLDMEEYRDLELTLAAFMQVLDEPEFHALSAGIVLQAYLPDSWSAQHRLTEWAMRRVAGGGASVKLRIVKGANLAMESVEAELHGWNAATYASKAETDANYRRMLEYGCHPTHAAAVRIGAATHNLFDAALALVLRNRFGTRDRVELEMLEGMANHQLRAAHSIAGDMLVYAPVVDDKDFIGSLAYLVRRLDENTSPQNFLHDLFDLTPQSDAWRRQSQRFVEGWADRAAAPADSRRRLPKSMPPDGSFANAPDTDWTQADRRAALKIALDAWTPPLLPPLPTHEQLMTMATGAIVGWRDVGVDTRAAILRCAADVMETHRFETIAQMVHEAKKVAYEADIEVSEAVDFARYAAATAKDVRDVQADPLGVVVVTPPWNFPLAIPCGGVVAALAMGNAVILKPAPETVGVAWLLASRLWEAGVPREVLQFYPCPDGDVGRQLITDPRVAAVVLTGSYETARLFLSWRPALRLYAETSGKNAIVITAQADRDLAIKDLVKSAFGHAGQKCSAASLSILDAEVYDDADFRRALCDAAASLRVGPATDLGSVVTPLIREPSPDLLRALTTLEPGESWLLEPRVDASDPCLWSPGIKLGIRSGSRFHQTECFGPMLGLMRAETLDEAIAMQNGTPFGLTAGIHSLDDAEVTRWRESVQAGNAYVNRPITGAVVRRQPFGGWKRSSLGPRAKAGGPNYVTLFARLRDRDDLREEYQRWWDNYFTKEHDPSALACESNVFRYRPCRGVVLRVSKDDATSIDLATRASAVTGVPLHVSLEEDESESALAQRLPALNTEFFRTCTTPGDGLLAAVYACGMNWIDAPLLRHGRYELPRWLREQSVSETRHRYGMIVASKTPGG